MAKDGIEKIKKKILGDADAEVKRIKQEAADEVSKIKKKNAAERKSYKDRFEERTVALVESYKQKTLAQARLDAKKSILQEREQLIDAAIARAIEGLDRKGKAYERFLDAILSENKPQLSGKITITCNKVDKPLVSKLAKGATVVEGDLDAGLILADSKGKRVDESLDALLARKRDEVRQAVAGMMQ
jgi:V/A-type H+-transporting ATPase subunit E